MKKFIFGLLLCFMLAMTGVAFGATYSEYVDGSVRNPNPVQVQVINKWMQLHRIVIDISQFNAGSGLDAGEADVGQVLIIPKDCFVKQVWIRVTTAAPTNSTIDIGYGSDVDYFGNAIAIDATGVPQNVLVGTSTWDAASIGDGNEEVDEITVNGAALGDPVLLTFSLDVADLTLAGSVTAADTVTAQLGNWTGGAIDLDEATATAYVLKAPLAGTPLYIAAEDTLDIKATDDTADVDIATGVIEVYMLLIDTTENGFR